LKGVEAPCDVVELELGADDLQFAVDREQAEALHLILTGTDVFVVPLPKDLIQERKRISACL
jgi:hypothetical protein